MESNFGLLKCLKIEINQRYWDSELCRFNMEYPKYILFTNICAQCIYIYMQSNAENIQTIHIYKISHFISFSFGVGHSHTSRLRVCCTVVLYALSMCTQYARYVCSSLPAAPRTRHQYYIGTPIYIILYAIADRNAIIRNAVENSEQSVNQIDFYWMRAQYTLNCCIVVMVFDF